VHERPPGLADTELIALLSEHWDIAAGRLEYLPVGFGGFHWRATDSTGSPWFVTVNSQPGGVSGPAAADFVAAMDTAVSLASAGLGFVVAPIPGRSGQPVGWLGPRYTVTVFPYSDGTPGHWEDALTSAERAALIEMLAALHDATGVAGTTVPIRPLELAGHELVTRALRERHEPWLGGPYAEPARALLNEYADCLGQALGRFTELTKIVRADGRDLVITHGEPHPGNLVRSASGLRLVDWDTVGLAPPERDLWSVLPGGREDEARYTALTGREVSADAMACYRLRWTLDELSLFLAEFRGGHEQTADTQVSWSGFRDGLISLAGD
jgi:spectinomycin phosphotransferase